MDKIEGDNVLVDIASTNVKGEPFAYVECDADYDIETIDAEDLRHDSQCRGVKSGEVLHFTVRAPGQAAWKGEITDLREACIQRLHALHAGVRGALVLAEMRDGRTLVVLGGDESLPLSL